MHIVKFRDRTILAIYQKHCLRSSHNAFLQFWILFVSMPLGARRVDIVHSEALRTNDKPCVPGGCLWYKSHSLSVPRLICQFGHKPFLGWMDKEGIAENVISPPVAMRKMASSSWKMSEVHLKV